MVENQCNQKIKVLRSDQGGEYISREFEEYCQNVGIQRQLTAAYSPQQNGVAERKNRVIDDMANSMLQEKGMPKSFWAEAVNTAVYILKRSPTKAVPNRTPFEAWFGQKHVISHMKIFGCICYAQVAAQKRTKFDPKSERCIFLGYADGTKGYRLYNLKKKKIIISRDVIFDEKSSWDWEGAKVQKDHFIPTSTIEQLDDEHEGQGDAPNQDGSGSSSDSSPSASEQPSTPIRLKSLAEIYESCNFSVIEP